MSLKLRPKGTTDPFYNPSRDLAYCYPQMVEEVVKRFNQHRWSQLEDLVAGEGVTFDHLCDAMDAYIKFLNEVHKNPEEPIGECMARSGWLSQPQPAQIAIMAMLGTVCTGQLFFAIRDESGVDEPLEPITALAECMGQAKKWMYAHPWRTKLMLLYRRLRLLLRRRKRPQGAEVSQDKV